MVVDLNIMLKLIRNIEESAIKDNSIYIVEVSDGLFKLYCGSNVIFLFQVKEPVTENEDGFY